MTFARVETHRASDRFRNGLADIGRGLVSWRLWALMGWLEVNLRYRRSVIGPFWITLSLGVVVVGLGVVYSTLFKQDAAAYIPYLATGLIVWTLISTLATEGCQTFIAAEGSIKMLSVPLSVYAYRLVWRNLIVLAHNLVIYLGVIAYFGLNPGWTVLVAFAGIVLVAINGVAFGFTLGILSARFRDIPLMVVNGVQLVFFVTPILWRPESLAGREWIYRFNPFHYLIDIIRSPLLGWMPSASVWFAALAFTVMNLVIAVAVFSRFRWRIAYWV